MHRFFLTPECIVEDIILFPQEIGRQISRVLRLIPGDHVMVLDNNGFELDVVLESTASKIITGSIISRQVIRSEPFNPLTLFICMTQREKFEWMLQKCTEIGVSKFVPVISSRTILQHVKDSETKKARWEKIIKEAAEQSGRGRIPTISRLIRFNQIAETSPKIENAFILWENEQKQSLRNKLGQIVDFKQERPVSLLVGPEGGFSDEEISFASSVGFESVSLGKRILRMETAAVVACALVLFELGDMG